MVFARGEPQTKLEKLGPIMNRRGTKVRFKPDEQIFGKGCAFKPARLLKMARSKAYLFGGVEIRWTCDPALINDDTPAEAVFHFPGGLTDYLTSEIAGQHAWSPRICSPAASKGENGHGSVEWAIAWIADDDGFSSSYCNTIPTPEGGTHEAGLRTALSKGLRAYGELTNNKKAAQITADDVMGTAAAMLSVFIREPEFQGQTKDQPRHAGSRAHRRERGARRLRPLAGRQPAAGDEAARMVDRPGRGAPEAPAREGNRPPDRDAQAAPARQARRLLHPDGGRHRDLHRRGRLGRRLRQERARPRDAGHPAAARQDPQRRQRHRPPSCRRTSCSPTSSRRSASAPAPSTATTTCATSASSS